MADVKNAPPASGQETEFSITELRVDWAAARYSITVKCCADPVTVTKLANAISRLLAKSSVSDVSISVSVNDRAT
jgi:hypothetical protein